MASCKKGEESFRESRKGKDVLFFYYMKKYLFYINMRLLVLEISFYSFYFLCNLLQDVCFDEIIIIETVVEYLGKMS